MKSTNRIATSLVLTSILYALGAPALQAQASTLADPYVITANDIYRAPNSASVFRLLSSALLSAPALETKGWGIGGAYFGNTAQAVVTTGTHVCVFVTDPGSDDIAAFTAGGFTNPTKVGNYRDPSGSGAYLGTSLAARGALLFAGYTASTNIGVWIVNSDCSLTLGSPASHTPTPAPVDGLAVSPDGRTLIATFAQSEPGVGSYAIGGTTLTPRGPYNTTVGTAGVDITKDSRYALIGEYGGTFPQVEIFPINSDSSLGASTAYSFPQGGFNSNNLLLSPDETRVYINNNGSAQVTTLSFNEHAPPGKQLSFYCLSNPLRVPPGSFIAYTSGIATSSPTGKGGHLYMVEATFNGATFAIQSGVALLQIPTDGLCPAEVSGSPFALPAGSTATTLSAFPPRPF
jgi:hypothetical protein